MIAPSSLMSYKVIVTAIAALVLLSSAFISGWYINGALWEAKFYKESAKVEGEAKEGYKNILDKYTSNQQLLSSIDSAFTEWRKDEKIRNDKLVTDLRNGNEWLSVLIKKGQSSTGVSNVPIPGVDEGTEIARLDGKVAAGLAGLISEGDDAIIVKNACAAVLTALETGDQKALQKLLERYKEPPK